ncbi:MAG: DUF480 domain-containing protein [Thermodesulfobacteriota bacterium]
MPTDLDPAELRVLGCLLEKELATPDYYPLSLAALLAACNQKTSREPVVSYDEATVQEAVSRLKDRQLVWQSDAGRVSRFGENLGGKGQLVNREKAVLAVLLLRGPQTVGEIRQRTDRLHTFASSEEVEEVLSGLVEGGMVARLARQPGQKEARCRHLLGGQESEPAAGPAMGSTPPGLSLSGLSAEVAALREEVASLRQEIEDFRQLLR